MENNMELEQMREQMELLRGKLERQELVNEKMIIGSMKQKMSGVKKLVYIELFCLPFIVIIWVVIKFLFGISWWNVGALFILSCIDVLVDYNINIRALKENDFAHENLIETVKKLLQMKHRRFVQMAVGIPLTLILFGWTCYEIFQNISAENDIVINAAMRGGLFGGIAGCIIGLVAAFYCYRKLQQTNDEVINDIKELQAE